MKKIDDIEFHDLSIDKININFEDKNIVLSISIYDKVSRDYDNYNLIYSNVTKINFIGEFSALDYSAEINELIKTKHNDLINYEFKIISNKGDSYTELSFEALTEKLKPIK